MSEKPCQLGMVPQLLEWAEDYQERKKKLGCKQLTTQDHSQGFQLLGIVFSQSPVEARGWRRQACHSILHNALEFG